MSSLTRYSFPTSIVVGTGARREALVALKKQGCERPLLVTDRGVAGLPWFASFTEMFEEAGFALTTFSALWGNPLHSQVNAGVESYKAAQADAIIGLGGGAAMDVAKVIGLMVNHPGDLFDYEDGKPDALPVDQPIPYMLMLPTTAGTGSEVGRASVISDDQTKQKKIVFDAALLPKMAILDPELSVGLPPALTAATGIDALSHLVEAYLAKGEHPMCDGIALEGIKMISEVLLETVGFAAKGTGKESEYPEAVAAITEDTEARHLEVRTTMLQASMMGAVAFQKGLGATHSCAHALSAVNDLHHGLAIGITMPYVMDFNSEAVPERFAAMARAAGQEASADAFLDWLRELNQKIQLPTTLKEVGVTQAHMTPLLEQALADGCHQLNPRACDQASFTKILTAAIGA